MGLIIGSGSFTRFMVEGDVPENFLEECPQRISHYAFRDIDEASDQEQADGWVNIMDMFDSGFSSMEYLKEPCIAMSWRVDKRTVPAKALKRYCREAEEKIKSAEELEYLPKARRREIREALMTELLRRAIPRTRTFDMIWNLHTGLVIFGATGNKLCDEFAQFFLECFGLHLNPIFPYSLGSRILETGDVSPDVLDGLNASVFSEVR